jgi:hypothetical protein
LPLPLPLPSEFCNDENNNVNRLAMDALRNKKNYPPNCNRFLFLAFFNLILDAPHTDKKKISI